MNFLEVLKIAFCTIIIFEFVECSNNCTITAKCKCLAQESDEGQKSQTNLLPQNVDICNINTTKNLQSSTDLGLEEKKNIHFMLFCENVNTTNKTVTPIKTDNVTFILSLVYPCAEPVPKIEGYSTGSILVIMFFTCVFTYLGLGIAVRLFLIGARGIEVFPHLDFWRDFPSLIRDGVRFIQNGCTARPSELNSASPDGYDAI